MISTGSGANRRGAGGGDGDVISTSVEEGCCCPTTSSLASEVRSAESGPSGRELRRLLVVVSMASGTKRRRGSVEGAGAAVACVGDVDEAGGDEAPAGSEDVA